MPPLRLNAEDAASLRAVVLLQRYSLGLNRVSQETLDDLGAGNTDMQILLLVGAAGDGMSPSGLVAALARPRSTVSRRTARLLAAGLLGRRPHPVDRRRAGLHLTARGRTSVEQFERSLRGFFDEGQPLVKEVMLLQGRDPERGSGQEHRPAVLEVADRMSAAGAALVRDLQPRMRTFGVTEVVDRFALMVLGQGWARPSWLADELGLSPAGTTSMLERLEGAGLVVRETGGLDTDRRAVVVHLTAQGRRAARAVLEVHRDHWEPLLDALAPTIAPGVAAGSG